MQLLVSACNSKQKQLELGIEETTQQEMEESPKAAQKVTNVLQPKSASLVFTLEGTTYELETKGVDASVIPFAMYKPANKKEGETEESSLIWLKGTDAKTGIGIRFSVNLKRKMTNGKFTTNKGEVVISNGGKEQYYGVKKMNLNISNLSEKPFNEELSAYSLDMSFSGTIAEYGANGKIYTIRNGRYNIGY